MNCPDADLLRFLAEMLHPLVRPNQDQVDEIRDVINGFLARDGYQLEVVSIILERRIFAGVTALAKHATGTDDANSA